MNIPLTEVSCCHRSCGVTFFITEGLYEQLNLSKREFFCPNGHPQHYIGESNEARIRRLVREKEEAISEKNKEIESIKKQFRKSKKKPKLK